MQREVMVYVKPAQQEGGIYVGTTEYRDYWTGELVAERCWAVTDLPYCPLGHGFSCSCKEEGNGHIALYDLLDSLTCVHVVFEDEPVTRRFEQAEQRVEEAGQLASGGQDSWDHGSMAMRKNEDKSMTRKEYRSYEQAVHAFFEAEGITNLSANTDLSANTEENWFSWSPCDCCGQAGGTLCAASGYAPAEREIKEYNVCQDCVYYAEYGQLDDQTMLDMDSEEGERSRKI